MGGRTVFWPLIARTQRLRRSALPSTALSSCKADEVAPRVAAMIGGVGGAHLAVAARAPNIVRSRMICRCAPSLALKRPQRGDVDRLAIAEIGLEGFPVLGARAAGARKRGGAAALGLGTPLIAIPAQS